MKKLKNLLKKSPIAMIVIGLVIASVVSAALVDYLSNTIKAKITVESPMAVGISLGLESWATAKCYRPAGCPAPADWTPDIPLDCDDYPGGWVDCYPAKSHSESDWTNTGTLVIPDIYGGEPLTLYIMSANLANATTTGYEEIIITNPLGVTCADFESITSRYDSIYGSLGYGEESVWTPGDGGCTQGEDVNTIQFGSTESTWGAGETDVSKMVVTFKSNALGTYTVKTRVVPVVEY
ncbi:MAG: hypothetical protein ACKKMW_02325 [Candidatus Nealsonbacteria bacterium]